MRAKYGSSLIPSDSVFLWMVVVVDFFDLEVVRFFPSPSIGLCPLSHAHLALLYLSEHTAYPGVWKKSCIHGVYGLQRCTSKLCIKTWQILLTTSQLGSMSSWGLPASSTMHCKKGGVLFSVLLVFLNCFQFICSLIRRGKRRGQVWWPTLNKKRGSRTKLLM